MKSHLQVVNLQETCLASKDAMPFDLLKKKLFARLNTLGIRIVKTYEEVTFMGILQFLQLTLQKGSMPCDGPIRFR